MQNILSNDDEDQGKSLGDIFSGIAKDGVKQASDGFASLIQNKDIGSAESPEADRVQKAPLRETLAGIAREGLDPLMGRGFERETHAMAADQYSEERRRGSGRDFDSSARDLG